MPKTDIRHGGVVLSNPEGVFDIVAVHLARLPGTTRETIRGMWLSIKNRITVKIV